jgi:hypothetical protein
MGGLGAEIGKWLRNRGQVFGQWRESVCPGFMPDGKAIQPLPMQFCQVGHKAAVSDAGNCNGAWIIHSVGIRTFHLLNCKTLGCSE